VIRISDGRFLDGLNRSVHFRGVNLGGSSKLPFGIASHHKQGLNNKDEISFVGRPFPLENADEHFLRLKTWGFNLIRFVVTWEAIEHAGLGKYDQTYLDYVRVLLEKAASYGFYIYIDPHQDAWSRFSGGDGAPAWTLEIAGFDVDALAETGAATLHAIHGSPFPHMIWGTNYGKLASATMFTLFWAGRELASKTHYQGKSIQDVLQESYIAAFSKLANTLSHIPNVIGYGVMNEPSAGFIGVKDLRTKAHSLLLRGPSPSVLQAMGLGAGLSQNIEVWELGPTGLRLKHVDEFNKNNRSAWHASKLDIWQQNGVWKRTNNQIELLRPQHFSHIKGKKIQFYRDFYIPFAQRYMSSIDAQQPSTNFFVEGIPADSNLYWPAPKTETEVIAKTDFPVVHAPHWYDVATLITKRFLPWLSFDAQEQKIIFSQYWIKRVFKRQLEAMKRVSKEQMNNAATLIGEVGIPMDLENKKAFKSANYQTQVAALDNSLNTLEKSLLSYCIWNYTADNSHTYGDGWNAEDFSIYSAQEPFEAVAPNLPQRDLYLGGRALAAFIRPYAPHVTGNVTKMQFDLKRKTFELSFTTNPNAKLEEKDKLNQQASIIYLPSFHYLNGYSTTLSDGELIKKGTQELHYYPNLELSEHTVVIKASK